MKTIKTIFILLFFTISFNFTFASGNDNIKPSQSSIVLQQAALDGNNIGTWIWNTGVFNQDLRTTGTPGFIWPNGLTHAAIFSSGLSLGAYIGSQLRLACASYRGEYVPGYCTNGTLQTNSSFKLYRVNRSDNPNSPDWANWGLMVPYGAPFKDVNNNGTYEPAIDTPGVKGSAQTIFVCLTDADPTAHTSSEGFSGGTAPMGAEVHLTAWCYNNPGLADMDFLKWVVINKNSTAWDSTRISLVCDPDLGDGSDDYIGCDSVRHLAYCFNSDNTDGNGTGFTYGSNPPACGMIFLSCGSPNLSMKGIDYFTSGSGPSCEQDPTTPLQAYNYMKCYKRDGSPWINPAGPSQTFYCYPGDPTLTPHTLPNWTEFTGSVQNCGGSSGSTVSTNAPGDRRFVMNFLRTNQRMNPGDTQVVEIAQLIARGSNNLNSVTLLKSLSDTAKGLCENNFIIGIHSESNEIPNKFSLYQNYPNPFNPTTKIKFDIAKQTNAKVTIYDAVGKEIAVVLNEELKSGTYSIDWNASEYPSGVYFYKLQTENYSETKKMVLIK